VLRQTPAAQQLAVSVTAPRRAGFYEVWMLGRDGTSMISLGDLNTANTGTFTLPAGVNLRFYSRIDVSLQPFNGSTLHSSISVVRGSMPSAAAGGAEALSPRELTASASARRTVCQHESREQPRFNGMELACECSSASR
jgi:hypothetical protein